MDQENLFKLFKEHPSLKKIIEEITDQGLTSLTAISPLDGRYWKDVKEFSEIFSVHGLQKQRVFAEIQWLNFLGLRRGFIQNCDHELVLSKIIREYTIADTQEIQKIDDVINHDVKAVERYIRNILKESGLNYLTEWVHFGLTSEDITNIAIGVNVKKGRDILVDELKKLIHELEVFAKLHKKTPMLSHTHGQPASPTTAGKEAIVFTSMLREELEILEKIKIKAKLNCATGNFSALNAAYPGINWIRLSWEFIANDIGLYPNLFTVQTNSYNYIAQICDCLARIGSILINLDRDFWTYISMEYFVLKVIEQEVGSSTMPNKVNPINYENSEGNMELALPILKSFSNKLLITRMQRDLSDSTFLRNLGVPFGHMLLAIKNTRKGLGKISINKKKLLCDLRMNQAVLAEPIQTVMRAAGVNDPYSLLKDATRGKKVSKKQLVKIVNDCKKLSPADKKRLNKLTPEKYIGLAVELVDEYFRSNK